MSRRMKFLLGYLWAVVLNTLMFPIVFFLVWGLIEAFSFSVKLLLFLVGLRPI